MIFLIFVSFKVEKRFAHQEWEDLLVHLISGHLPEIVNGASISPKKNFNIIKIWLKEEIDIDDFVLAKSLHLSKETILYRSHKSNIEKDKMKNST